MEQQAELADLKRQLDGATVLGSKLFQDLKSVQPSIGSRWFKYVQVNLNDLLNLLNDNYIIEKLMLSVLLSVHNDSLPVAPLSEVFRSELDTMLMVWSYTHDSAIFSGRVGVKNNACGSFSLKCAASI